MRVAQRSLSSHVGFYCVSRACKRVIRRGRLIAVREASSRRNSAVVEWYREISRIDPRIRCHRRLRVPEPGTRGGVALNLRGCEDACC